MQGRELRIPVDWGRDRVGRSSYLTLTLTPLPLQSTQPIWSASCISIRRPPGAWAMTEAG